MLGSLNKVKLVDLFLKIEGVPHRGKMSTANGNCKAADGTESSCNGNDGCFWVSSDSTCKCKVGYGSAKGDATDCAPCTGNTVNTVNGTKDKCTECGETRVGVDSNDAVGSSSGNVKCVCKAGYGTSTDGSTCVKCEGTKYKKDAGDAACGTCTGTGATGLPASATSDGNTICGCDAGYSGANGTDSDPG